jgi:hypothetical protein
MTRARTLLLFFVASVMWLPWVQRLYAVDADERDRIRRGLAERQIDAWSQPPDRRDDVRRMRGVNPEWDFMSRTYTVLALADLALEDDREKERLLRTIDTIVDDTLRLESSEGDAHFLLPYAKRGPFLDPEGRSVFVDGEILLMIAAREIVAPRPALAATARERAARIERAMRRSPSFSVESYPDECWTSATRPRSPPSRCSIGPGSRPAEITPRSGVRGSSTPAPTWSIREPAS